MKIKIELQLNESTAQFAEKAQFTRTDIISWQHAISADDEHIEAQRVFRQLSSWINAGEAELLQCEVVEDELS